MTKSCALQHVDDHRAYGRTDENTLRYLLLSLVELCGKEEEGADG